MVPEAGEIYLAEDNGRTPRPVVVVSRQELNRGKYVVVVPMTSQRLEERWDSQNCVPFQAGQFGLTKRCVAQAELIAYLEMSDLILENGPIGKLNEDSLRDLVRAIGYVISSDCEPVD